MESQLSFESHLRRFRRIPRSFGGRATSILIYDRIFERRAPQLLKLFPRRIAVRAGEDLKSLATLEKTLSRILPMTAGLSRSEISLVSLGGGSVGDFTGFCASVLKRGVDFVQIPSTWLAAVDSAHGGKTALNVGGFKNQIGTFWPAREIWLIEELLSQQPVTRLEEAWGEIYKIALIDSEALWRRVQRAARRPEPSRALWSLLPDLIAAKNRVVQKDPFERTHQRALLNLGHTVGHLLEARCGFPHGKAVLFGLAFAAKWSQHQNWMQGNWPTPTWILQAEKLPFWPNSEQLGAALRRARLRESDLATDKKAEKKNFVREVFVDSPGQCEVCFLPMSEFFLEIQRQSDGF